MKNSNVNDYQCTGWGGRGKGEVQGRRNDNDNDNNYDDDWHHADRRELPCRGNRNDDSSVVRDSVRMDGAKSFEAALGGFEFGETAAFLLDQIVFGAANVFRRGKNGLPVGFAFTEQNRITLRRVRRPILAMQRVNAARVRANPSHRIRAGFEACADVELQH